MERKLVTIVFADLVGSTALADEQDPERTRALLDRFYDEMASEIGAAGGTIEKFAGDAVMAAFGAPVAHEDDAEPALRRPEAALGGGGDARALGLVEEDETLLERAIERFEAMSLDWHADETRKLAQR